MDVIFDNREFNDGNCEYVSPVEFNNLNNIDKFHIFHQNIRSFNRNFDSLSVFLNDLSTDIDIIALSETWFSDQQVCDIEGYNSYHIFRSGVTGGGISVFVRDGINTVKVEEHSTMRDFVECCSIDILGDQLLSLIAVYRPPGASVDQFLQYFEHCILPASRNKNVIICGDLNIDILRPSTESNNLQDCLFSFNFHPLITLPTRVTDNTATCIDHIWSNTYNTHMSGIFKTDVTDHFSVICSLNYKPNKKTCQISFRDHSQFNLQKVRDEYYKVTESYYNDGYGLDLNGKTELFLKLLYNLYDRCCPIKNKTVSIKRMMKPWLTDDIVQQVRVKHDKFSNYKIGLITFNEYNDFKNRLLSRIRSAKRNFFRNKFQACRGNLRRTWAEINRYLRGNKSFSNISLLDDNGIQCDDPKVVANIFCNYFSTVATDLSNNAPICNKNPLEYLDAPVVNSFFAHPATVSEVTNLIGSLPNKNSDANNMPTFILKLLANEVSPLISELFNMSLEQGIFPECLKTARIVPIFKASDRLVKANYRPISIIVTLSKIFEKLMNVRMLSYINKFDLLSKYQFGFRQGMSTADAIHELVNEAIENIDRGRYMISVFIDLKKAFDTVNHVILLDKMHNMGFRGVILNWFKSYLRDRVVYVDVNGNFSERKSMNIGVPQGSISGSLLFLLYINDMHSASSRLKFTHFADDTTVSITGDDLDIVSANLNSELSNVEIWLRANRLLLNAEKTSFIIFSSSEPPVIPIIRIGNKNVSRVHSVSFLGLEIDDKLKFNNHIDKIMNKLNRSVGIMFKMAPLVPATLLKSLYFTLVYPHLTYGITVWGHTGSVNLARVERVQRRAIRLIKAASVDASTDILHFNDVYCLFILSMFFKYIHFGTHHYFTQKIISLVPDHVHYTRFSQALKFNIPSYNKAIGQKFFLYQAISMWNELPTELANLPGIYSFKRNLKSHLLSR